VPRPFVRELRPRGQAGGARRAARITRIKRGLHALLAMLEGFMINNLYRSLNTQPRQGSSEQVDYTTGQYPSTEERGGAPGACS
jgi:hypothetical protein